MDSFTEVLTWGSNTYGQMGLEASSSASASPRICSFNILIAQVSCGSEHSAFLSTQHLIYSMGSNSDGRLGVNDKSIASSPYPLLVEALAHVKITQISCGGCHTGAISHEGEVYTWGKGPALGHSEVLTRWSPHKLALDYTYVVHISCGESHTGVVGISNKEKVCLLWGSGEAGQLGNGGKEGAETPQKALVADVKEVACGEDFTLFLTVHGEVYSCGKNSHGQLGLGNTKDAIVPTRVRGLEQVFVNKVGAGGMGGCVAEDGGLYVWGFNTLAPSLIRGCPKDVVELAIGKNFGACITRTSALWTWGDNGKGQLGLGDLAEKDGMCIVHTIHKKKVRMAACGKDFIIVLGEDLKVKQNNEPSPEKKIGEREVENKNSMESVKKHRNKTKERESNSRDQFWSTERNENKEVSGKNSRDLSLYETAIKKLNKLLMQKDKELQHERESRLKNENYRKIYKELEEKFSAIVSAVESEKQRREELELSHTKKEATILTILREREDEVQKLKNENANLRRLLEDRPPCTSCINIQSEFNYLKQQNDTLLYKLSKKGYYQSPRKISGKEDFSPDTSGRHITQSPSFDKSLDKSLDRHKQINYQLKISRSESELLKLIETPMQTKSPGRTDRSNEKGVPLLKLDCEIQDEYVLPTFRNQENSFSMQKNLKNSLAEIKARISALNSNRSELENKMGELEMKLSHSHY